MNKKSTTPRTLIDTPLYKEMVKRDEISDFRWTTAKVRIAVTANAKRLDDIITNGDGTHTMENMNFSDRGHGAAAIYATVALHLGEVPARQPKPKWRIEFDRAIKSLAPAEQRIARALMKDLRPVAAARIAKTSRVHVWRTMRKLRPLLIVAHRLWLAERTQADSTM